MSFDIYIYLSQESVFMVLYIKNPREPQHNLHKENSYCYVSSWRNVYVSHKISLRCLNNLYNLLVM